MERQEKRALMKKTALVSFVVLMFVLFSYLFTKTFSILLLFFGGLLFSIFFHTISDKIHQWTNWHKGITLVLAILLVLVFFSGISFLIGNTVKQQYDDFAETVPETIDNFKSYLEDTSWGQYLLDFMPSGEDGDTEKIVGSVGSFFRSTFGFFGDLYALFFLGAFLLVGPGEYKRGVLSLLPEDNKKKGREIIEKIGSDLRVWLKAQVFEMIFVFTLTAIGLLIMGVDLWLILAIIAGTLTFIPNIGPTVALIPAILVGLLDGVEMALLITALFLLVQTLESGIFGPFVRKKMLSLPPALVLFFQLLMGTLTGAWGILFATPLLVALVILVNEIYVKSILEQEPVQEENG